MSTTGDRLVLYIEETDYNNSKIEVDTRCYILFDELEQEYFVCGSRMTSENNPYAEFKFYCKSRHDLYEYLSFVMNFSEHEVNVGFFNYVDLFENHDKVDFNVLNNARSEDHEIAFYFGTNLKRRNMISLLSSLKYVRY